LPEGRKAKHKNYFIDFLTARPGAIKKNIVFTDAIGFSIHYFQYIKLHHFKAIEGLMYFPTLPRIWRCGRSASPISNCAMM
jgi:hypothetical protein